MPGGYEWEVRGTSRGGGAVGGECGILRCLIREFANFIRSCNFYTMKTRFPIYYSSLLTLEDMRQNGVRQYRT